MKQPDINEQIQCVRREIRMRERVYPGWVDMKRMTQAKADRELETMRAVEKSLVELAQSQEFTLT